MSWFYGSSAIDTSKTPSIVLVGDGGVGKTTLFDRISCPDKKQYKFNKKYNATIGFNLKEIQFETNKGPIATHVWDTAGQEKFGGLREAYVHGADIVIVMYDVTVPQTRENVFYWLNYLKKHCKDPPIVCVCGNKEDKLSSVKSGPGFRSCVIEGNYTGNSICNKTISVRTKAGVENMLNWVFSKHYNMSVSLLK